MVDAKCKVSFDTPNSLASVLGFKQDIVYAVGRQASEKLVNIMSVNSYIIHSSYMRGQQAPVVYNFFPNACTGQKILQAPHNSIYLPVTVDVISTLYYTGLRGVGVEGVRGVSGPDGSKGPSGEKGNIGWEGLPWIQGLLRDQDERGEHGQHGERGENGTQGDASDVLSVLATHLPIQLAEQYGEKMCFIKYHVSADQLSVVRMTGGVHTLRNVSAYKEPTWSF